MNDLRLINENSIWCEHPKYPGYRFSPEGACLSVKMYRRPMLIMKPNKNRDGYITYTLSKKSVFAHRVVADIFVEKPIDSNDYRIIQVNHKNGKKDDNRMENLEWVTPCQNQNHSRDVLGNRCAIGELSGSAVLTKRQVYAIRLGVKIGKRGIRTTLAKRFGISNSNITAIVRKRSWDHL